MKTLLWLGNPYFSGHLRELGWDLVQHRPASPQTFDWQQLVTLCGKTPDVVVLGDNSMPPMLLGLEDYPCLTAFYCVDSHIHSWHPAYAQAFDLCCLNLKDNIPGFAQRLQGERLAWTPLYAPQGTAPPFVDEEDKDFDLLFVGNVHPELHPGRYAFLQELGRRCPALTVTKGRFHELFPRARIVLNYAERGDLNFRVFQALGLGACLLTPFVGHGMLELFQDGEELFCYDPQDMDGLLHTVDRLLATPQLREAVARKGLAAVDAAHRAPHRAEFFSHWLMKHDWQSLIEERRSQAFAIHGAWLRLLYLHFAASLPLPLREEYLRHARRQVE